MTIHELEQMIAIGFGVRLSKEQAQSVGSEVQALRARCEAAEAEVANQRRLRMLAEEAIPKGVEVARDYFAAEAEANLLRANAETDLVRQGLDMERTARLAAEAEAEKWRSEARRALAAERSRDEARAEVERLRGAQNAEARIRTRERDEAREALREMDEVVRELAPLADHCGDCKAGHPCKDCLACAAQFAITTVSRVLSGEKDGAPVKPTRGPRILDDAFQAGAEWMREQAARAVESTEEYSFSVAVKMAPSDHLACAVSRIRSLPVSPPAPEEDKP